MWYKYLNRQTDEIRVWRRANLKFNQDDVGMFKTKYVSKLTDKIFRMVRTEGVWRGTFTFIFVGACLSFSYIKKEWYDPKFTVQKKIDQKKEEQQINRRAREKLYYNRVNAPSRPTRSIQDLMTFLVSAEAINRAIQFISYEGTSSINSDQLKGLDSWMSDQDTKMLDYYQQSLNKKTAH